jgi:CRISPR/Cas system-associated exonuclease Cas4 (RecB family)
MTRKAWSFSALKTFETCPRKYHAEKVEKLYPFEETEHTIYGKKVHLAAEKYIRDGEPLPKGMEQFKPALDALNNIPGDKHCELEMALTADRKPTDFKGDDVWVRGIADLVIINGDRARVVDYKTGSAKYPDKKQLELMALMVFEYFPEVTQVKAALAFLLHDVVVKGKYNREEADKLWQRWDQRTAILDAAFENDNWPPNPNGLCRKWCPVVTCEFNGRT